MEYSTVALLIILARPTLVTLKGDEHSKLLFSTVHETTPYAGRQLIALMSPVISADVEELIENIPKAELHVHIEGCMPPDMVLRMAQKNGLLHKLPFRTVEEAQKAFDYKNLQEFLDLRDASLQVLVTKEDFYEVMMSYLSAITVQTVWHTEIFFDPQVHTLRGIEFSTFMSGFLSAIHECCAKSPLSVKLLMCFMTELGPKAAEETLEKALPYIQSIAGVGIARGIPNWKGPRHPHSSFSSIFRRCAAMGLRLTAHAGEEGPPDEIWEAIKELHVDRIDHGVSCLQDVKLMDYLKSSRLPLTICPLSNWKLQVYKGELFERMRELLKWELCITVNSDDPPFFSGYINENFKFWAKELGLSREQIYQFAVNSFEASFLSSERKNQVLQILEQESFV